VGLTKAMPEFADLSEALELPQCTCLNASSAHTLRHCLGLGEGEREDTTSFLQSDTDEELLISLKFMSAVKVSAISITAPKDSGPSKVRLFVNKVGLDFDSAKSDKSTQDIDLTAAQVAAGSKADVRFVNFQNVQTLGIFISGNFDDLEETVISKLIILGESIQQTGMKRSAEEQASASKGDWLNPR